MQLTITLTAPEPVELPVHYVMSTVSSWKRGGLSSSHFPG